MTIARTLEALDTEQAAKRKYIDLHRRALEERDTEHAAHEATKVDAAHWSKMHDIEQGRAEKAEAELQALREGVPAIRAALDYAGRNICAHEDTERGGFIWTICQQCGAKWADDQGGFEPSIWPEILDAAMDALRSLLPAPELDPLVAVMKEYGHSHPHEAAERMAEILTRHGLTIATIGGKHDG